MLKIDEKEFSYRFSKSSGAGGQNVNKVNTKVTLVWDIGASSSINSFIKDRFIAKFQRYIVDGNVIITSSNFRSQKQNIDDCKDRLYKLLDSVKAPPKKRKPTKPTRSSVKKRLDSKKKHSDKKRQRSVKY